VACHRGIQSVSLNLGGPSGDRNAKGVTKFPAKIGRPVADRSCVTNPATSSASPARDTVRAGRGWRYVDGFLVNEYLGRVGHTPAWIVEVEGSQFRLPQVSGLFGRIAQYLAKPRIIQRNRRRLAFAWPLIWPPPDEAQKAALTQVALAKARSLGAPTGDGCGVCGVPWEGGPALLDGRARHLCYECAEVITLARAMRPPGSASTWLWCAVAGFCGLLLQLLFHVSWGWTAVPLALIAGWLMGTANGPNFERRPVFTLLVTVGLLLLFQVAGWAFIFGAELRAESSDALAQLFVWTLCSLPPSVIVGWSLGTVGVGMALLERRLHRP